LLSVAVELARAAGALLLQRPDDLGATAKSTPTDAVTKMDRAAERVILDGLARRRPHDRVVAEESGTSGGGSDVTWFVDPLDGTVNYLYDIPHWAVSIAAAVGDTVVAGVVFDPHRDETFQALRGRGATCNGRPLAVSAQADPAFALVATGFSYAAAERSRQAEVLRAVLPRVRDIRRAGSAALDLCAVAASRVDAFFEAGMYPWDWAAGGLIAEEAGATFGGVGGRPPGAWTTLVANPALFVALDRLLLEAGDGPRAS
jgi:fructose-1,6-bisphosphatase/inositol monophosphatase family enzyme